jgi:hypothetical protein
MYCEGVGWIGQSQDRVRWVGLMVTKMNQQGFSECQACFISEPYLTYWTNTVAARSKAWTVFARSNAEILRSNPTRGMDVCVRLFCVCIVQCR